MPGSENRRPSAEVDLNHYGRDFPAWLRHSRASGLLGGLDYLPDLARLERAVNEAYYAADVPQAASASEQAPQAILSVTPSLRTVASRYPVDVIWRVNLDGDDARQVVTEPGWRHIAIWRSINQVTVESVPAVVFRVLRQLARDPRLGDLHRVSDLSDDDLQGLYRYAMCLTRDRDRAYDLVHTVIVRWLAAGRTKVDHPCRYLLAAVRNQYFDQHRREQALHYAALDQDEQIWRMLRDAEREVLFLWAVEGFTVSEISAHTGVPRGTLLARIHRLRQRILALDRVGDLKAVQ